MSSAPEKLGIVSTLEKHPNHVYAIGMVSIETANLDLELGALLGSLLRISRKLGQNTFLTPNSGIARIKIIENVAESVLVPKSEGLKRIQDLLSKAKAIVGKRHDLIHSAWGATDTESNDPKYIRKVKLPAMNESATKPIPLDELTDLITKARILIFDIRAETNLVIESWPKPSPGKSGDPIPGDQSLELFPGQKRSLRERLLRLLSFRA